MSGTRTERDLRDAGRVGVVQHRDLPARGGTEQVDRVHPDPPLVDVRGGAHHAAGDHAGQRHADRSVQTEPVDHLRDDLRDRLRRRR
jgi:hypothetical protein